MPRERKFIRGDSTDKKFDDVERVLQLMSNKLHKTATVIIPPIPFSFAVKTVPVDGEIFRGFFSVDGHISRLDVLCENVEKGASASVTVSILGTLRTSTTTAIRTGFVSSNLEIGIPAGSRVIITVDGDRDKVSGLWACALYETHMGAAAIQPLVIDDILAKSEKLLEDDMEKKA